MCATALVLAAVATVAAGAGAYVSIQSANAQAAQAEYNSKLRQKQVDEARRNAEIQALQEENARTADFQQKRSSALAAIGAAGLGEHLSFVQGMEPEAQSAYLRDVRNIRLNLTAKRSTMADEVQVAEYGARIAKANAGFAKIGALADFVQTAASAYSFATNYGTPTKPTPVPT